MSALDLAAMRERATAATARSEVASRWPWPECHLTVARLGPTDRAFVSHARVDVPVLAADVLRLADEVERLQRDVDPLLAECVSAAKWLASSRGPKPTADMMMHRLIRITNLALDMRPLSAREPDHADK